MENNNKNTVTQFLTFYLDNEIYALDINRVREVLDLPRITHVPNMPDFMRGVINLRGKVVPVVDLRKKFNLADTEDTVKTCIIIIEMNFEGQLSLIGAVADSVQEVIRLDDAVIEPAPSIGNRLRSDFILGMINRDGEFMIILDITKVFSLEELEAISSDETELTSNNVPTE